ncbi:MAG: hypothetical protein HC780_05060 [Leptolyngbyaceae cyanobacterium CSU_1_3]|nr:hypothetical protein [Leptolyngbyaceae cyanobacterium CSU_1_3]
MSTKKIQAVEGRTIAASPNSKLPSPAQPLLVAALKLPSDRPTQATSPQGNLPKLTPDIVPTLIPTNPSSSAPAMTTAALNSNEESYTLGAGDKLRVEVFNVPEYSKDYQVLVNGTLNYIASVTFR